MSALQSITVFHGQECRSFENGDFLRWMPSTAEKHYPVAHELRKAFISLAWRSLMVWLKLATSSLARDSCNLLFLLSPSPRVGVYNMFISFICTMVKVDGIFLPNRCFRNQNNHHQSMHGSWAIQLHGRWSDIFLLLVSNGAWQDSWWPLPLEECSSLMCTSWIVAP